VRLVKIPHPRGEKRLSSFSTAVENLRSAAFYDGAMPPRTLRFEAGDQFELPSLPGRALPRRVFTETYYDTAGGRLARAGFVLSRRVENGKGLWRLNVVCDGATTLDVEAPGGPATPPEELRELVSAASAGFELAPTARVRTRSTGLRVKDGSRSLARIVVASVALLDGQRATRSFHEIEVERLAADRKELAGLESALEKAGATRTNGAGPLEQALAREPQPELPLPTSSLEVLRPYLRDQYARMLAHDPGVRVGEDPEDVHQLRVATRRLRSVLRTARPLLDGAWVDEMRGELAWLAGELGPARDLDVLIPYLRREARELDPADRKALAPLFAKLDDARAEARDRALEALRSERYLALLAGIEAAAAGPPPGPDGSLTAEVRKELKKLRKAMRTVDDDPTDEAIHRARIKGKRARYATELVEDELGKPGAKLLSAAKEFQDAAGEHQDTVVAEARIRSLLRGVRSQRTALAAGMLVARQRERRREAEAALPKAWRRYEEAAEKVWS
jgi:CHAD domain-containing protein